MATPRIFVSSTCYDLQEIRFQLRYFIREFGYDAVMSEFDDIFYSYEAHVQDACLDEIAKCQLFILVVGNNYGSFYHQDKQENKVPDSITLREFRRALEVKVYKHIFINKYVDYDYKNYKRALEKVILKYFQDNKVEDDVEAEEIRKQLKIEFDKKYHFPYESYRYVFYFLDIINELRENNAINPFESFVDIKDTLRKQWAGFMYESLTKKEDASNALIQPLEQKIDKIEKSLQKLIESKMESHDNKITFDVASLSREAGLESLEKAQDTVERLLYNIRRFFFYDENGYENEGQRVWFNEKFSSEMSERWLESLRAVVQSFKLSKNIHAETVFKGFPLGKYHKWHHEIPYKTLFELYSLYNSLNADDKTGLIHAVTQELNKNYEKPAKPTAPETINDLPF